MCVIYSPYLHPALAVLHLLIADKVPRQAYEEDVKMSYSISPVSLSRRMLSTPSKAKRKIPKIPFKVGQLSRGFVVVAVGKVRRIILESGPVRYICSDAD